MNKNIILNDGRLIENLTLTLDSRLTVFTGANGSGKTSILKALAACIHADGNFSWVWTNRDIGYRSYCVDISDVSDFAIVGNLILDSSQPITAYSKGEQAIIGLYWSIANELKSVNTNDRILVLIDDLGNDLDPDWQSKILPSLLKDFPAVQFVITTTCPLVLDHVQPDNLFFLKKILTDKSDKRIKIWQATDRENAPERILGEIQQTPPAPGSPYIRRPTPHYTNTARLPIDTISCSHEINNNYTLGK